MKNQLITIQSCITDNNYDKVLEYTNSILEKIEITKKFVFTKNDIFNAIVNNKLSEANSNYNEKGNMLSCNILLLEDKKNKKFIYQAADI